VAYGTKYGQRYGIDEVGGTTNVLSLSATLTCEAILSANAVVNIPLATTLTAGASISPSATVHIPLAAVLVGEASLTATATVVGQVSVAAVLTAGASLTANAVVHKPLAAVLTSGASIVADLVAIRPLAATLTCGATLTATVSGLANATLGEALILHTNTTTISSASDVEGMLRALRIKRNRKQTGTTSYKVCTIFQGVSP
jgi:hypothetical protein